MNVIFENGQPQFDIPKIEPMELSELDTSITLDPDKMTLRKGDEEMVLLPGEIELYYKGKKYAFIKPALSKTKHYKLKRFLNKTIKTKFKIDQEELKLHVIDEETYKKLKEE